jgi:hypothetical protein
VTFRWTSPERPGRPGPYLGQYTGQRRYPYIAATDTALTFVPTMRS